MKEKVLIVCPLERDRRELSLDHVCGSYEIIFDDIDKRNTQGNQVSNAGDLQGFNPSRIIHDLAAMAKRDRAVGVLSSGDYPGSVFSNIIAHELELPGVQPELILQLQHKFYARCLQQQYVPDATPFYTLLDVKSFADKMPELIFPIFVKPVKSFFSLFANIAYCPNDIRLFLDTCRMPQDFLDTFDWFMHNYTSYDLKSDYLLAEGLLQGQQVTVEGYMFDGQMSMVGIVDSVMFPGTISFERFMYPSSLPDEVQDRMCEIAKKLMLGVAYNNSFFNIEMIYNLQTNSIHIIEVNTRMVSQFADLYEKVDGTNSYTYALDLATGKKPNRMTKKGKHAIAASLVLRIFEDKYIKRMPIQVDIERVYELFPDVRIQLYGTEGKRLSDEFQDGKSFRYGLIHLGARDEQELNEKYAHARDILGFEFI